MTNSKFSIKCKKFLYKPGDFLLLFVTYFSKKKNGVVFVIISIHITKKTLKIGGNLTEKCLSFQKGRQTKHLLKHLKINSVFSVFIIKDANIILFDDDVTITSLHYSHSVNVGSDVRPIIPYVRWLIQNDKTVVRGTLNKVNES